MKILRVITRLNVGGPARQCIDLNRELTKRGHECVLVSGPVGRYEGRTLEHEACCTFNADSNACSYLMQYGLRRELGFYDINGFRAIRRLIKDYKPDIVHTHTSKAGFLTRCAALTAKPRPRLVHTFHGNVFSRYFTKSRSRLFRLLEQWLAGKTDAVISISSMQQQELAAYRIPSVVVSLGFDLGRFLRIPALDWNLVNKTKTLRVGIVGRLCEIKNHELFFQFCDELEKAFPDFFVLRVVVGGGERLQELAVRYDSNKVLFTGWQDKMEDIYRYLDLVVCTSKNEGTPVALIEAMASGRLVVSTDVGGVRDLVGKGSRGVLLNGKATAETVRTILNSYAYKLIVERARKYVAAQHSLSRLVDDIEALYAGLY